MYGCNYRIMMNPNEHLMADCMIVSYAMKYYSSYIKPHNTAT